MGGSFTAVSTSWNARRTLRSSSAVPMVDVNTRSDCCQSPPAFNRSRFCCVRCRFSTETVVAGSGIVESGATIILPTEWAAPSVRSRQSRQRLLHLHSCHSLTCAENVLTAFNHVISERRIEWLRVDRSLQVKACQSMGTRQPLNLPH
jgi:hypothetical protein